MENFLVLTPQDLRMNSDGRIPVENTFLPRVS
jgi:hypothetical protein